MNNIELAFDDFLITTDKTKMDITAIHDYLSNYSYWCRNIPIEKVKASIGNSLNFGLFHGNRQVGFARVISDLSTIAYLGDVYILEEYRGRGLSKKLMEVVMKHPDLQGLRRWILLTSSAGGLYEKYGFTGLKSPELYMELYNPGVYEKNDPGTVT
jgi:GNAT superfamily N-acetyltransferase